ncbi:formyltransferase family protein [Candidatus Pelagibacter sp.]|nr:formyltransferase family protein [Candidatus Pelagibacter sp.]
MNIVIVSQKPIQTLNLIYLLGGMDVFPSAIVIVKPSQNNITKDLLNEYSEVTVNTLKLQCDVLNIPLHKVNKVTSDDTINLLNKLNIDLILLVVLDLIVKDKFLNTSKHGVISSHGGILPFYRGVDCLRWSILNREKEIGTSTMILNSGVDTGNVVSTNKINLENELPTNIEQLGKKFYYHKKLYAYLYPIKQLLENGYINTKKQKTVEGKQYFSMHKELSKIVDTILLKDKKKFQS